MTKPNRRRQDIKQLFGSASFTTVSAVVLIFGIIILMISAAARDVADDPLDTAETFVEPVRIIAPGNEVDTFTWNSAEEEPDTYSDDQEIIYYDTSLTFDSPEITTEAIVEETASESEPTASETAEASETVTADANLVTTNLPQTTVETTAAETADPPVTDNAETSVTALLADKLGVVYTKSAPDITVSEDELTMAATIIQLEVMGNGSKLEKFDDTKTKYWEMLAVAQCIRNRAGSGYFPDSVKEVILDSTTVNGTVFYQFSPASRLDNYTPTEEAVIAAREVLIDGVTVIPDNYYYFCASNIESRFEKNNTYSLSLKPDGTYDKMCGETTTFYAGFDETQ